MNLDAFLAGDKAKDVVSKNGVAALGHLVVYSLDVLGVKDQDVVLSFVVPLGFGRCLHGLCSLHGGGVARFFSQDEVLDGVYIQGARADSGVKAR